MLVNQTIKMLLDLDELRQQKARLLALTIKLL